MLNLNAGKKLVAIFDPDAVDTGAFWSTEMGTSTRTITANRKWMQSWELFTMETDEKTKMTIIKSEIDNSYLRVTPENVLRAGGTRNDEKCQFILGKNGSLKSVSSKMYVNRNSKNELVCTSGKAVPFTIFNVSLVNIANESDSKFFTRTTFNGTPAVCLTSNSSKRVFLLQSEDGCYLEWEADWQYIYPPLNDFSPLTWALVNIEKEDFKFIITPVEGEQGLYTIKSPRYNKYVCWEESGGVDYVYCRDEEMTAGNEKFRIYPAR